MTVTNRKPSVQSENHPPDHEPGHLVECDSCNANITHSVHIRCAAEECKPTGIDICPSCFCKGKEVGKHKAWHPYRVVERHSYPIFSEDWGADEELLLIDGLLASGLGSWADAADYIGTRTKEECESHYNEVYVSSKDWPLPDMEKRFDIDFDTFQQRKKRRIEDLRAATIEIPAVAPRPLVSGPTNHELAGFMPGRLEFETEVDNDAEEHIKDLEFGIVMEYGGADQPGDDNDDRIAKFREGSQGAGDDEGDTTMVDVNIQKVKIKSEGGDTPNASFSHPIMMEHLETPNSLQLKLALLEIYNERVDKRLETKAVVFDRGLLEFKKLQAIERKRPKEERDFINKHKPFARLQTASDFEAFIDGLLYEMSLRKRIQELQEYRRMGITSLAEAEKYEKDKISRLNHRVMPAAAHRGTGRQSVDPESGDIIMADGLANPAAGRKHAGPLNLANAASLHLLTPAEQTLCSQLRILPKPYLVMKETLVREYAKREGKMRRREARDLIKIDVNKTSRIWDFLMQTGLLKSRMAAREVGTTAGASAAQASSSGIKAPDNQGPIKIKVSTTL